MANLSDCETSLERVAHRSAALFAPWYKRDGRAADTAYCPRQDHVERHGNCVLGWTRARLLGDDAGWKGARPVMLALVDVANNYVLGQVLVSSENAVATVALIRDVVERHGIPDRLYTDNGSAFAGHLVAGGNVHRFRNAATANKGLQPPGICKILGINLTFALPGNGQAKIAERTFATLSRVIDDRPEFAGAHAGHTPGASPSTKTKPVPFEMAQTVMAREIARHNNEVGRRSQGAKGRSYSQVFEAGQAKRIRRVATKHQLWLASLQYYLVAVDRDGQVQRNGWTYGSQNTLQALLPHHRPGAEHRILLGVDPTDYSQPAIAFDPNFNLICEDIQPVKAVTYNSKDGARDAARDRKAAQKATQAAKQAQTTLSERQLAEALARLDNAIENEKRPTQDVVVGRFGAPLRKEAPDPTETGNVVPKEYLENMDRNLALKRAQGRERT